MKTRIPSFAKFVNEYSQFDGIDKSLTEDEHEGRHLNYQAARKYLLHMLAQFPDYNSEQAQIMLDRTVRKFELNPAQQANLEVDLFDWENRDNAEMHEKLNPMLTPRNMMNYLDRVWKTGRPHAKQYIEFKVPIQR